MPRSPRSKRWDSVAAACRLLAVVSLLTLALVGYATRVVFDPETFASRASESLAQPAVARYISEHLADAVIDENRDLLAYRPLLVVTARSVVSSEAFRAVFRRAARSVHEIVLSRHAEKVYVSIPDASLLLRSALAKSDSDVLDKIPREIHSEISGELDRVFGERALALLQLGARMQRLVLWLRLGTLLLLVLGVALAVDRRRALMHTGIGVSVVAFGVFWLPELGAKVLELRLARAPLQALVVGMWSALSGGLHLLAAILAGMGLVLVAAASALAGRLTVSEVLGRAWSLLQRPLDHPLLEVLRALGLLGLGLFIAFEPMAALKGLFVVIGAFLAFEGLSRLFALLAPHLEETARPVVEVRSSRFWRWVLVGGVVVVLVVTGGVFLGQPPEVETPRFTGACNGSLDLCGRPLDEIVFAGAHNAMAAADVQDWMFPNQERGIPTQLQDGIRALLIDVHYGEPVGGRVRTELADEAVARKKYEAVLGTEAVDAAMRIRDRLIGEPDGPREPYLCHGFCELGAQRLVLVLRQVHAFLVQNPGEVLIVVVEDYVTPTDLAAAFSAAGLREFVFRGQPQPPWPTLKTMITTDQRVLVLAENTSSGVSWIHPAFDVIQETPYGFHGPEEFSCAPNRGGTKGSLLQLNHWIESAPTPKPSNAALVNSREFLLQRVRKCEKARHKRVNLIAVDFYRTGDLLDVVAELNRRPPVAGRLTQATPTRATTTVMLSGPPR